MSLLLTLNSFHTLFWRPHCWLWTSKYLLGYIFENEYWKISMSKYGALVNYSITADIKNTYRWLFPFISQVSLILSPLYWQRFTFSNFCNCFKRLYKVREGLHQKKPFMDVLQNRCLKNFAIFTGKIPVLESLFNKVAGLKVYKFIKKRLQYRCSPVNIAKFLKTSF